MTLPPAHERMEGDVLGKSEAMRLFIARALAVNPRAAVGAASFPAIAGICERLDGLPLAIELAAARASVLTPPAILARLDSSLHLLTQGARDQPERQQSLRGAIAWSYDLLLPKDQAIFRSLSMFSESFSYEAVEQIVQGQTMTGLNLLDSLATLVDSSLVRLIPTNDNEIRYRMLETIKEFGRERLLEAGELEPVRHAQAMYFADLAKQAVAQLHNVANDTLLDRLDQDLGNFRQALTTLNNLEEWDRLLHMSGDIAWFLFYRGQVIEAQGWVENALQHAHQCELLGPQAWALIGSGLTTQVIGDVSRSWELFAKAAEIANEGGEEGYRFVATNLRAGAMVTLGRIDEAAKLFESNLDRTGHVTHSAWLAHAKFHLGIIAFQQDRLEDAGGLFAESIELDDQDESYLDAIDALQYLSLVQIFQQQLANAGKTIVELLDRLELRKSDADLAIGIAIVAAYLARLADAQGAVRLFAAANQLRLQTGLPFPEPASTLFISVQTNAESKVPAEDIEAQRQSVRFLTAPEILATARDSLASSAGRVPVAAASSGKLKFSLTDREIDVLRLIADGLTNEQIANALFISSGTVRTHAANIFGKLNARTRTEAARIALRNGLI